MNPNKTYPAAGEFLTHAELLNRCQDYIGIDTDLSSHNAYALQRMLDMLVSCDEVTEQYAIKYPSFVHRNRA